MWCYSLHMAISRYYLSILSNYRNKSNDQPQNKIYLHNSVATMKEMSN